MRRSAPFTRVAPFLTAILLAVVSLGGLLAPAAYARETPAWIAQAIGQDWFDLVVAAPWLAICGLGGRTGSLTWKILLAGGYGYAVYELAIYVFAVHFNALFLIYCASLGTATFALIGAIGELRDSPPPSSIDRRRARLGGGFLIAVGILFAMLWLGEDVPAVLRGATPTSLTETGLLTNPVHVLDLSFVLPAHVAAGVWLWRRDPRGLAYGPILMAFGIPMALSIGGMMVVIGLRGGAAAIGVIAAMPVVAAVEGWVLARVVEERRAANVNVSSESTV